MTDDIQSLRRKLADAEENLRLLQERKAKYVLETDIPLQIVKDERRWEVRVADLRERLEIRQEPLTQLYEQLQDAAAHEEWTKVLALAEQIRALAPGYRDMPRLVAQARERLQRPKRRPVPTWWAVAGGVILVLLLGLGLAVGSRLFGSTSAPTEAPTERLTEPTPEPGVTWTRPADGMVMVGVPGGTFRMGSAEGDPDAGEGEFPQHSVTLDGFWIDQTEVTNAQYRQCVKAGACQAPTTCDGGAPTYGYAERADHPVVCVNWHGAAAYCEWAGARLPAEAEWEYAARGPQGFVYPWGDEFDRMRLNYCDANCEEDSADVTVDDGYAKTSPAGNYPAGASWCGALDMAGNVWEWVVDWYGSYPSAAQANPPGPETGDRKVLRGGGWNLDLWGVRAARRGNGIPEYRAHNVGFRCVGQTVTVTTATTQRILVQEDFGSNVRRWGEGRYSQEQSTEEARIFDGKLRMSVEWREGWIRWKHVPDFIAKDFLFSVDVVIVDASNDDRTRIVIVFREKDSFNTYIAKFSSGGSYQIGLWQNDEWKVLHDWEPSDAIRLDQGVGNTLGILVKGPRFTIYANDQELVTVEDSTFTTGGRVGLGIGGEAGQTATVDFDNLIIKEAP